MKKLFLFVSVVGILTVLVFMSRASDTLAYTMPTKVRVGLEYKYKEVTSVPVSNQFISIGYEQNGSMQKVADVIANAGFSVKAEDLFYVKVGQNSATYEEADRQKGLYMNTGQNAVVAFVDVGNFAVYLGGYGSKAEAEGAAISVGGVVANASNHRTVLMDGNRAVVVFDNPYYYPQIADAIGDALTLGDRKYRGVVEFGRYKGAKITAVNVLTVDEYLISVVPSEMPAGWSLEALKAQAISARNYTITRMGVHNEEGYHLCDQVHCQSYLGAGNEAVSTTQAVMETSGIMVYYNNEPINAVYFSSSGGVTENSDNVWPNNVPYLRSVNETYETTFKEWTRAFTLAEISALARAQGINIGEVTGVAISSTASNGRVSELIIKGTNGNKSLYKEEIRTFFSGSDGGKLESKNFVISNGTVTNVDTRVLVMGRGMASDEYNLKGLYAVSGGGAAVPVTDAIVSGKDGTVDYKATKSVVTTGGDGNTIVFSGKGWGHGVGMSQFGAKGMAEAGFTYKQILEYYYTSVEVR